MTGNAHPAGVAGGGEFVEKAIGDGFVEYSLVAEGVVIVFEGFEFDAGLVGDVFEFDGSEIGETGFWTDRCEFGAGMVDGVVAVGGGVWESFEDFG